MNIHSFMARTVDVSKMERIKEAAISLFTSVGFSGASIEQISAEAGVSIGYMYRHYKSKSELAEAIYEEKMGAYHQLIFDSLKNRDSFASVVSDVIDGFDDLRRNQPKVFSFIFLMLHDHNFKFPQTRLEAIRKICHQLYQLGRRTKEINPEFSAEEVFYTLFSVPLKFFDSRVRKIFVEKKITPRDVQKVKLICVNALR